MSGSTPDWPQLRIEERSDDDGSVRLALGGELDLAVVDALDARLVKLKRARRRVRLDLAELEFIDSTGLHELILAVADAERDGWDLEIDPHVSEPVRRVIELTGLRTLFWPETG
jgi:anti-sigma B factor antagonist